MNIPRFDIYSPEPAPDGDWVKFEDCKKLMNKIECIKSIISDINIGLLSKNDGLFAINEELKKEIPGVN